MRAEISDRGNSLAIDKFVFYQNELDRGNPYNTTFNIYVTSGSGSFRGVGDCECDIKVLGEFVARLREAYDFKRRSVTFRDICYGSTITLEFSKLGDVTVSGTLYADAMEHSLTFRFTTDQSTLLPFIKGLESMIASAN